MRNNDSFHNRGCRVISRHHVHTTAHINISCYVLILLSIVGFAESFFHGSVRSSFETIRPQQKHRLSRQPHSSSRQKCYTITPVSRQLLLSASVLDENTNIDWSSLTVAELRTHIKDLGLRQSDYKKKIDLVTCLKNQSRPKKEKNHDAEREFPRNGSSSASPSNSSNHVSKRLRRMPSSDAVNGQAVNGQYSEQDQVEKILKNRFPKDILPSQIQFLDGLSNLMGQDKDPRSLYHPIFNFPPVEDEEEEEDGDDAATIKKPPRRQSDMDLIFLGTASCIPGTTRGVSCLALRLNWKRGLGSIQSAKRRASPKGGEDRRRRIRPEGGDRSGRNSSEGVGGTWIFDCGEGSQIQLQKAQSVKTSKITKIFLTHAHGDHSFGLPGFLCLIGQGRERNTMPVDIYGPEGLRKWLRACIRYSVSRIVPPYRVHELKDVPMAPNWKVGPNGRFYNNGSVRSDSWKLRPQPDISDPLSWRNNLGNINLDMDSSFGEVEGGRDIYPQYDHPLCVDSAPVYVVEEENDVTVHAAPMSHSVPCVGYVVKEADKVGRLRADLVAPILRRNFDALMQGGVKDPMKLMGHIKKMKEGDTFTMPDGTVISQSEVVESPQKGRIVAICGDTSDSSAMAGIAYGADVLVHEATNAFLNKVDVGSYKQTENDAIRHGHSTPQMAGEFASRIKSKRLVLNHFSPRYPGDPSIESIKILTRIEKQARDASKLPEAAVAASWDFMTLPIPYMDANTKSRIKNVSDDLEDLQKSALRIRRKLKRSGEIIETEKNSET